MTKSTTRILSAVSLFCGAGGDSLGLHNAGFDLVAGVDNNETAIETHAQNLPGEHIVHDLADVTPGVLPDAARSPTVLAGGFPCQPFSGARIDGNGGRDDDRAQLGLRFIEWVRELRPKIVVFENVPALKHQHPEYLSALLDELKTAGYRPQARILNAADFGVPQTRERLVTIAVRGDVTTTAPVFPMQTHSATPKMLVTGERLDTWRSTGQALETLGVPRPHRHKGGGRTSLNPWRDSTDPSHTVTATGNNVIDYEGLDKARAVSVEESKVLQSFPESFAFAGDVTVQREQIGNAVPPRLMEQIGRQLRRAVASLPSVESAESREIAASAD